MVFHCRPGTFPLYQLVLLLAPLSNVFVIATSDQLLRDYKNMRREASMATNLTACSYRCVIYGETQLNLWYPELLYQTVITKIVVISTLSGQPVTSTSLLPANFTSWPVYTTFPGNPHGFDVINQTTRVLAPTRTMSVTTRQCHSSLTADCLLARGRPQCL